MINLGLIECTYPAIVTGYEESKQLIFPNDELTQHGLTELDLLTHLRLDVKAINPVPFNRANRQSILDEYSLDLTNQALRQLNLPNQALDELDLPNQIGRSIEEEDYSEFSRDRFFRHVSPSLEERRAMVQQILTAFNEEVAINSRLLATLDMRRFEYMFRPASLQAIEEGLITFQHFENLNIEELKILTEPEFIEGELPVTTV